MKYDIRVEGNTVQSFGTQENAEIWLELYQKARPDKVFSIVKDYGKAGE